MNKTIKIGDDMDKAIEKKAVKEGLSKAEVANTILKELVQEMPKQETKIELAPESVPQGKGDVITKLIEWSATNALVDKIKGGNGMEFDLNKLLAFQMVKQVMQPQPQQQGFNQLEMMKLLIDMKGGGNDDKLMTFMMQQQQLAQQQMQAQQAQNVQLMQLMFGGKIQDVQKQLEDSKKETGDRFYQMMERMEKIFLDQRAKGGLTEELTKYANLRKSLIDWAADEGMTKEDVVSKEGKLNVPKILDRFLRIGEQVIKKMPVGQPPMKTVTPIEFPPEVLEAVKAKAQGVAKPIASDAPVMPSGPQAMPARPTPESIRSKIEQHRGTPVRMPKPKTKKVEATINNKGDAINEGAGRTKKSVGPGKDSEAHKPRTKKPKSK